MATRIVGQEADQPIPHESAAVLMRQPKKAAPSKSTRGRATARGASGAVDQRWRAEADMRTLMEANEIKKDPMRLAAAQGMAKEKLVVLAAHGVGRIVDAEQATAAPEAAEGSRRIEASLAAWCFNLVSEHLAQLHAVSMQVERLLGDACNRGLDAPDGAPLTAWRLSQVMEQELSTTDITESFRGMLRLTDREIRDAA